MTIDLTRDEAEVLIAVLMFAEGAALVQSPPITEAMKVLEPMRSRLVGGYIRERISIRQPAHEAVAVGPEGDVPAVVPLGRIESPRCEKHGLVMVEKFRYERINASAERAIPTGEFSCIRCGDESRAVVPLGRSVG